MNGGREIEFPEAGWVEIGNDLDSPKLPKIIEARIGSSEETEPLRRKR